MPCTLHPTLTVYRLLETVAGQITSLSDIIFNRSRRYHSMTFHYNFVGIYTNIFMDNNNIIIIEYNIIIIVMCLKRQILHKICANCI